MKLCVAITDSVSEIYQKLPDSHSFLINVLVLHHRDSLWSFRFSCQATEFRHFAHGSGTEGPLATW